MRWIKGFLRFFFRKPPTAEQRSRGLEAYGSAYVAGHVRGRMGGGPCTEHMTRDKGEVIEK
jgi:hypothetical protein